MNWFLLALASGGGADVADKLSGGHRVSELPERATSSKWWEVLLDFLEQILNVVNSLFSLEIVPNVTVGMFIVATVFVGMAIDLLYRKIIK